MLLVDSCGRVFGVLVGTPADHDGWLKVTGGIAEAMKDTAAKIKPYAHEQRSKRGTFVSVTAGVSLGGGQTVSMLALYT